MRVSRPRQGTAARVMTRSIGVRASSARSLQSPRTAFRRVRVIATDIIDDKTYGRSFTYSWIVVPLPFTSLMGSMSSSSAEVHRSSETSG